MNTPSPTPPIHSSRVDPKAQLGSPASTEIQPLHSLVYVSAANLTLTGTDLHALLEQSRRRNETHDITGLLLYRTGTFLQFLEGGEDVVEELYSTITGDRRHHDLVLVRRQPQTSRQFPDWTMAYGTVDPTSTDPVQVEMPPPSWPAPKTSDEAKLILELLDLFDPSTANHIGRGT